MGGRLTGDDDDGQMARRGSGDGVEEGRERGGRRQRQREQETEDTTGTWYDADRWCDQWY